MSNYDLVRQDGGKLLRQVENSITITNKILVQSNKREVVLLFLDYPDFFLRIISRYYPLSDLLIEKYKDKWDWQLLSENATINWTIDFLEKYKHKLNWESVSNNELLPWSEEFINQYSFYLNWPVLSFNIHLPWSEEFFEKYIDKWHWYNISGNKALPWTEEFIEKFKDKWSWISLSQNRALPWSDALINKYSDRWVWGLTENDLRSAIVEKKIVLNTEPFYIGRLHIMGKYLLDRDFPWTEDLIRNNMDKNWWWSWSINEKLPWSLPFIDKYLEYWDWDYLSANYSLPWSYELIDRYIDKWEWSTVSLNERIPWSLQFIERYKDHLDWPRLLRNNSIPWTRDLIDMYEYKWNQKNFQLHGCQASIWSIDLIEKYKDKLYWPALSSNGSLPWSVSFIRRFEKSWKWEHMGGHRIWKGGRCHWEKAFKSFVDDDLIEEVFQKI